MQLPPQDAQHLLRADLVVLAQLLDRIAAGKAIRDHLGCHAAARDSWTPERPPWIDRDDLRLPDRVQPRIDALGQPSGIAIDALQATFEDRAERDLSSVRRIDE